MGLLGGEPGDLPDGGDMEADLESILGIVFLDPTTEVDVQPRAMCLLHALVLCWVLALFLLGGKPEELVLVLLAGNLELALFPLAGNSELLSIQKAGP